jgi:predicted DNA-binding protein with PD1-like motif
MVTRRFTNRKMTGIFEVTSLIGNIALINQLPQAHLHVTVSGPDMAVFGGHLVNGTCSATLELIITKLDSAFTKLPDDRVGLNIWDLPTSDH